jgi:hypothetical protein
MIFLHQNLTKVKGTASEQPTPAIEPGGVGKSEALPTNNDA